MNRKSTPTNPPSHEEVNLVKPDFAITMNMYIERWSCLHGRRMLTASMASDMTRCVNTDKRWPFLPYPHRQRVVLVVVARRAHTTMHG
ncbi:hypothetical protein SLEP1_g6627 [Rubroshorea leprosula]|uniref:Uncharacterized protein n=1 Tax=Rubroshorea leprosula TaxID=152421 RepID=A0AAV5I6M4_9ROSI|nr:hypothetical protein SLEP1_g6627 [Rubroshorea leprosula]